MHSEWFNVPAETVQAIQATKAAGGRVVSVGTTTLRALESAARTGVLQAGASETDILITPGFPFQVVDRLLTMPEGTRLLLLAPIVRGRKGEYRKEFSELLRRWPGERPRVASLH